MHKVFPLTYLNSVSFSVSFPELDPDCYVDLVEFLYDNFGIEVPTDRVAILKKRPVYFNNRQHSVSWALTADSIEVNLNQSFYICYQESLLPLVRIIVSFLDKMGRRFNSLVMNKVNIIPVELKSYDELGENVVSTFSDRLLSNWNDEYFFKDDTTLLYLIKHNYEDVDIETVSGFISKDGVPENQPARYILDLTATCEKGVSDGKCSERDDLETIALCMNDMLYSVFTESVTEDILKSMEG